jgi:hypothetical protein
LGVGGVCVPKWGGAVFVEVGPPPPPPQPGTHFPSPLTPRRGVSLTTAWCPPPPPPPTLALERAFLRARPAPAHACGIPTSGVWVAVLRRNFRHLPVVDQDSKKCIGVVTGSDLLRFLVPPPSRKPRGRAVHEYLQLLSGRKRGTTSSPAPGAPATAGAEASTSVVGGAPTPSVS